MPGQRGEEIERLMRDALRRGRAAERVKGLAALSFVVREHPDNLVAFLWLSTCVARAEERTPRPMPATKGAAGRRA
jgi:hypothetical protein